MKTANIYVLIDPNSEEIRYVGWTTRSPKTRYNHHIFACNGKSHKDRWIRLLRKQGLRPRMVVIQTLSEKEGPTAERYWIAYFLLLGCPLTNSTEGGEGLTGYKFSSEIRAKMGEKLKESWSRRKSKPDYVPPKPSEKAIEALRQYNHSRKGMSVPEETREKMRKPKSKNPPRKPMTAATKEKLRRATLEQFKKPGMKEAVSKVHKGKTISPEHRAIVSTAAKKRWAEWRAAGGVTSESTRKKISDAKKGKPLSEDTRAKISAYQKGRPKSEEHRAKLTAANRAKAKRGTS